MICCNLSFICLMKDIEDSINTSLLIINGKVLN